MYAVPKCGKPVLREFDNSYGFLVRKLICCARFERINLFTVISGSFPLFELLKESPYCFEIVEVAHKRHSRLNDTIQLICLHVKNKYCLFYYFDYCFYKLHFTHTCRSFN